MRGLEYQNLAQQYALFPLDNSGWDYILSALSEEFGELCEAYLTGTEEHKLSECGDLCWNMALACKLLDTNLDQVTFELKDYHYGRDADDPIVEFAIELGKFSGVFAKNARKGYGRVLSDENKQKVKTSLAKMYYILEEYVHRNGSYMAAVFNQNINKLEERKRNNVIEGSGESVSERIV